MSKGIYNMSDPSNNSQNNEQILNDIQLLQQMEQQLFNNLETNTNLTVEQQQQIIEKISQLSNMRIKRYE
jgi:GTP-sensing pleiotropic transcriptional regulator CodY